MGMNVHSRQSAPDKISTQIVSWIGFPNGNDFQLRPAVIRCMKAEENFRVYPCPKPPTLPNLRSFLSKSLQLCEECDPGQRLHEVNAFSVQFNKRGSLNGGINAENIHFILLHILKASEAALTASSTSDGVAWCT